MKLIRALVVSVVGGVMILAALLALLIARIGW